MFVRLYSAFFASFMVLVSSASYSADQWDWSQYPDFDELRQEIGWSDDFSKRCEFNRPLREMQEKLTTEDWQGAAELGAPWLQSCPIDIGIHFYMGVALSESGQEASGEHHLQWMKGLMDSIVASGDGETPQTPFVVISVNEEYDYLNMVGLRPTNQSLVQGKTLVDAMTAVNREGREFTVYFSPGAHFARLEKIVDEMEMQMKE